MPEGALERSGPLTEDAAAAAASGGAAWPPSTQATCWKLKALGVSLPSHSYTLVTIPKTPDSTVTLLLSGNN